MCPHLGYFLPWMIHALGCCSLAEAATSENDAAQKGYFGRADPEISIDGHLDEPAWVSVPPVTRFFEIYPANVGIPTAATEARFLYDSKNIYIGIRAHDPDAAAIRSSFLSRDQVPDEQDFIEILIDPLNARHDAFLFRTNALGAISDGQFNEGTQVRDFAPDLNFDVRTAIDSEGWTAELRIPLSTLRYKIGDAQEWAFVLTRNLPRRVTATISSAPIPRGANCTLCFAGNGAGISLSTPRSPFYLTPQITYARSTSSGAGQADSTIDEKHVGFDAKVQPRPNVVIDLTVSPDFSQVAADAPQLTANSLFPLAVSEKRPFFLEGLDLLSTPINSIYTRALVNPEVGARATQRGEDRNYTALLLRDTGGSSLVEPGSVFSTSGIQESKSTVLLGRLTQHDDNTTWGMLVSGRQYDDGSGNLVVGPDATWAPSTSDRIAAQFLWSQTRNPNRPTEVATWLGQRVDGAAGTVAWQHAADVWNSAISYGVYSRGFRAWNGFVTQVGISQFGASAGLQFYPRSPLIVSVSPGVAFTRSAQVSGVELSRTLSPGVTVTMPHGTNVIFTWNPNAKSTSLVGPRSYDSFSLSVSTTPAPWMPVVSLSSTLGDGLNASTGEVGRLVSWQTAALLRIWDHFDLTASTAYQSLSPRRASAPANSFLTESNRDISATWYFSSRLYLQGTHQTSTLTMPSHATGSFSSLLLSYQRNWQTQYFIGFRRTSSTLEGIPETSGRQTEIFAKLSYVFSM